MKGTTAEDAGHLLTSEPGAAVILTTGTSVGGVVITLVSV